jgi:hypothetical protein
MKNLNLSNAEKDALTELAIKIKGRWPQAKLKIFGSKVKGTADSESDRTPAMVKLVAINAFPVCRFLFIRYRKLHVF